MGNLLNQVTSGIGGIVTRKPVMGTMGWGWGDWGLQKAYDSVTGGQCPARQPQLSRSNGAIRWGIGKEKGCQKDEREEERCALKGRGGPGGFAATRAQISRAGQKLCDSKLMFRIMPFPNDTLKENMLERFSQINRSSAE